VQVKDGLARRVKDGELKPESGSDVGPPLLMKDTVLSWRRVDQRRERRMKERAREQDGAGSIVRQMMNLFWE
jgi:hypothetical protein